MRAVGGFPEIANKLMNNTIFGQLYIEARQSGLCKEEAKKYAHSLAAKKQAELLAAIDRKNNA